MFHQNVLIFSFILYYIILYYIILYYIILYYIILYYIILYYIILYYIILYYITLTRFDKINDPIAKQKYATPGEFDVNNVTLRNVAPSIFQRGKSKCTI